MPERKKETNVEKRKRNKKRKDGKTEKKQERKAKLKESKEKERKEGAGKEGEGRSRAALGGADAGTRERPRLHVQRSALLHGGRTSSSEPRTAGGPAGVCHNRGASAQVSVASLSPRAPAAPASAETARFLPGPPPQPRVRAQGGHAARKGVHSGLSAMRAMSALD